MIICNGYGYVPQVFGRLVRFLFVALFIGCVEEFTPRTLEFGSALVIEATLTDQLGPQTIFLSRTYPFEEEGPEAESGAQVTVVDEGSVEHSFGETEPGTYVSVGDFAAEVGHTYRLSVRTSDGREYSSSAEALSGTGGMDALYAERLTDDQGREGIGIFVDAYDATASSRQYRYRYEETYKVVAPDYNRTDLIADPDGGCEPLKAPRRESDGETCYASAGSNSIILTNTNGLAEDRVERFMVRFIPMDNYIISYRYSILVRQYVQSDAAYGYYETLRDFSGSESLFSETQPGFLSGNVFSTANGEERVLGYFGVSAASGRRLFLNYDDFFPGEPLPPYVDPCDEIAFQLELIGGGCNLLTLIEADLVRYKRDSDLGPSRPYFTVPRVCGDCTVLGSKETPEFWIE
ncbi:MAG: DUF4249 domain-containing protein [Sediminicola sp.]